MVEPPGIAPGSGPLITSAFIAIVRANPDGTYIGPSNPDSKSAPVAGWREGNPGAFGGFYRLLEIPP